MATDVNTPAAPLPSTGPPNIITTPPSTTLPSTEPDLLTIAKEHGMNTTVRRSIFAALTTASDPTEAAINISKLNLRKSQKGEIPAVLLRCLLSESSSVLTSPEVGTGAATYNPFYASVARALCATERTVRKGLLFALYEHVGATSSDPLHSSSSDPDGHDGAAQSVWADPRRLVSMAKFYARLVRTGALDVGGVLKRFALGPGLLEAQRLFVEVLVYSVCVDKVGGGGGPKEDEVVRVLVGERQEPDMLAGYRYVLDEIMPASKVPEKERYRQRMLEACARASAALAQQAQTPVDND